MKNGRPDTGYLYWRWKPSNCDLPPFDPVKFLNKMRDKSWVFIGDSIFRNHFQSLTCMLSKVYQHSILKFSFNDNYIHTHTQIYFTIILLINPGGRASWDLSWLSIPLPDIVQSKLQLHSCSHLGTISCSIWVYWLRNLKYSSWHLG